jgi:hypothetical protein
MEKILEDVIDGVLAPHGAFAVFVIKAVYEAGSKVVKAVQKFNGKRKENQKKGLENEILQQEKTTNKIRIRILKEKLKRQRLKTLSMEREVTGRAIRSQKEQKRSRQDQTHRFRTQQTDTGSEASSNEPEDFELTQNMRDEFAALSLSTLNIPRNDVAALQGSIIIIVRDYGKYLSSNNEKEKFLEFSIDFFESKGAFGNSLQLSVEEFTNQEDVLHYLSNYYFKSSVAFQLLRDYNDADADQLPELPGPPVEIESSSVLFTYHTESPDDLFASLQSTLSQYERQILQSSLFFSFQSNTFFLLLSLREEIVTEEFLTVSATQSNSFTLTNEMNQELFKSFFDLVSV